MRLDAWLAAKAAIVLLAVMDVVASLRLADFMTTRRPSSPQGRFTVPFQTHGGVTYVSSGENAWHVALIGGGVLVVLAWWIVEHFEKRSRTR